MARIRTPAQLKRIKEYKKRYYIEHRKETLARVKAYNAIRKDLKREYDKKYRKLHRKKKNKNDVEYVRYQLKNNKLFKLKLNLRTRIKQAIRNQSVSKCSSSFKLLGATGKEVFEYITLLLKPGMTWDNYGRNGWHIDHIKPCSSFDLSDPKQQKKCFNYKNLQPLWAEENLFKSDKI